MIYFSNDLASKHHSYLGSLTFFCSHYFYLTLCIIQTVPCPFPLKHWTTQFHSVSFYCNLVPTSIFHLVRKSLSTMRMVIFSTLVVSSSCLSRISWHWVSFCFPCSKLTNTIKNIYLMILQWKMDFQSTYWYWWLLLLKEDRYHLHPSEKHFEYITKHLK